jgi:ankyrin repeat protein
MLSLSRSREALAREFLNWRLGGGWTPLMTAAKAGHAPVVDYLLSVGGSPEGGS